MFFFKCLEDSISLMNKMIPSSVTKEPGADIGLLAGGSQSVVVTCHSTYELGGDRRGPHVSFYLHKG